MFDGVYAIPGVLERAIPAFIGWGRHLVDSILHEITVLGPRLGYDFGYAMGFMLRQLINLPGEIGRLMHNVTEAIIHEIPGIVIAGENFAQSMSNSVHRFVDKLPQYFGDLVHLIVIAVIRGIPDLVVGAFKLAGAFLEGVWDIISQIPSLFVKAIEDIPKALVGAIEHLFSWGVKVADSIWQGFKKGLGIHSPSYIEDAMNSILTNVGKDVGPSGLGGLVNNTNSLIGTLNGSISTLGQTIKGVPAFSALNVNQLAASPTAVSQLPSQADLNLARKMGESLVPTPTADIGASFDMSGGSMVTQTSLDAATINNLASALAGAIVTSLAARNVPTGTTVTSQAIVQPVDRSNTYQIDTVNVQANDPSAMQKQLDQKARVSSVGGGR